MKQSSRLILTLIFFTLLIILARFITGQWFYLPSGDKSIWFQAGLLMVVLGSFFIEQHFTKPVDVVTNVSAGVITLLSLEHRDNFLFWGFVLLGLILIGVFAFLSMVIQTFSHGQRLIKLGRFLFNISTFLGSAKRLFSIILFISVFSYFQIPSISSLAVFIFWGIVVTAEPVGLPNLLDNLINALKFKDEIIGKVVKVIGGKIYQVQLLRDIKLDNESLIEVSFKKEKILCVSLNVIPLQDKKIINVVRVDEQDRAVDFNSVEEIAIKEEGLARIIKKDVLSKSVLNSSVLKERKNILGLVDDNSDIEQLRFKLLSDHQIEEGQLVKVNIYGKPVIYQIINAITKSESIEKDVDEYILVIAQQVGIWIPEGCCFESIGWVAEPGGIVFSEIDTDVAINIASTRHIVGNLPESKYPIHVEINDIITHHTAILGITGSGKTFLAYELVKKMVTERIKVIIFDISKDYARDLVGLVPKTLSSNQDLEQFVQTTQNTHYLGLIEAQPATNQTIVRITANYIYFLLDWAKRNLSSQQGENIQAKICVVFEEAHSLIPEWNSTSIKTDIDDVNRISQAILQGRKYGVGALVITQRTANITKTILNQCNTIFAFQSFDQTGLDFLKNYIGEGHAHALSTLLKRQVILFGKASSSRRPVIVKLNEQIITDRITSSPSHS